MGWCGKSETDIEEDSVSENTEIEELCKEEEQAKGENMPYMWHPTVCNMRQIAYVRRLERQHEALQNSFFNLSSQMARLQFRAKLINDLEQVVWQEVDGAAQKKAQDLPSLNFEMGDIKKKQHMLIKNLRQQIGSFQQASDSLVIEYQYHDQESEKEGMSSQKQELAAEPSETDSRNAGGAEDFMNSATATTETCSSSSRRHVSEVRSASFKELRDMFQRGYPKNS